MIGGRTLKSVKLSRSTRMNGSQLTWSSLNHQTQPASPTSRPSTSMVRQTSNTNKPSKTCKIRYSLQLTLQQSTVPSTATHPMSTSISSKESCPSQLRTVPSTTSMKSITTNLCFVVHHSRSPNGCMVSLCIQEMRPRSNRMIPRSWSRRSHRWSQRWTGPFCMSSCFRLSSHHSQHWHPLCLMKWMWSRFIILTSSKSSTLNSIQFWRSYHFWNFS